jgi:putative hydrolase of the HAD superfamily
MIAHVSFDVWNTLIKPNPEFSLNRTTLIALALNLDTDYVKRAYTHVKHVVDTIAETTGEAFSTPEVYQLFFRACGVSVSGRLADEIRLAVDELFNRFPPTIVDSVYQTLNELQSREITVSIASNSNFISGHVMHPWLQSQLGERFLFNRYSDVIGTAKPSIKFFDSVYEGVMIHHPDLLDRSNILHVGDNPTCDGYGAVNAGMHSVLVPSPDQLCDLVLYWVNYHNQG